MKIIIFVIIMYQVNFYVLFNLNIQLLECLSYPRSLARCSKNIKRNRTWAKSENLAPRWKDQRPEQIEAHGMMGAGGDLHETGLALS